MVSDLAELEKSVLNSVITAEIPFEEISSLLTPKDFSKEIHRLIFKALESLYCKGNPIEIITVVDELNNGPQRPDGGDWALYVTNVLNVALPLIPSNLDFHIKKLNEASRKRKIKELSGRLSHAIDKGDEEDIPRLIDKLVENRYEDTGTAAISLANRKVKAPEWLLEGLIPDRFPSIIYGAGGIGKSLLALYIGILACMGGQNFMGNRFSKEPRSTLYIDFELDVDEQTRRAQQISRGLGLNDVPENLHYFAPNENLLRVLPRLKGMIRAHRISFIIIDSIGASRTDGESVQDVVNLLTGLRDLGITTLVLDHQSKLQAGESYDNKTPFGSVYKENLGRSVLQLSRQNVKDNVNNTSTLRLKHRKTNFSKSAEDLIINMTFEGDRVLFDKSKIKTERTLELERIWHVIRELEDEQEKVLQKDITSRLSGEIGRDRVINLLKIGEYKYWDSDGGNRTERVYKTRNLENEPLRDQDSRILEEDLSKYGIPEELLDDGSTYN